MKMQLMALALLAAAAAGPALAQGTFNSGAPKSSWGSGTTPKAPAYKTYVPPAAAAPIGSATAKIYGPPKAATPPAFKPYEPYKPKSTTSLFGPDGKPKR